MSKYKVGDKVVLTVTSTNEMGCLPCYVLNDDLILSKQDIDKYAEPLSNYTEPLEAEITRLLAENAEGKNVFEIIEEQPQIKLEYETGKWMGSVCSCCGESVSEWYNFKFCPMCGAKMDDYEE